MNEAKENNWLNIAKEAAKKAGELTGNYKAPGQ